MYYEVRYIVCLLRNSSFVYLEAFVPMLSDKRNNIIFQYYNLEYMIPKMLRKVSSKFLHKFEILRIYILKDSRILLQEWACYVQKCKFTSHGITAPDVLLEKKKQKYVKPKNWSSSDQVLTENITFWEICGQMCIF